MRARGRVPRDALLHTPRCGPGRCRPSGSAARTRRPGKGFRASTSGVSGPEDVGGRGKLDRPGGPIYNPGLRVCKLIRVKSDVLTLVLKTEYVNRVAGAPAEPPKEKEDKALRILMMEPR